ncbi:MAG TPA: hypothetical protein VNJ03_06830 [Vicinamibacterales bacterium]|nr:hypothetical protein [Vicinamibacterales bacterium]
MRLLLCGLALSVATQAPSQTPLDRLISAKRIGSIQLGMTLGEARKAAPAAAFNRRSDGDGAALVEITIAPRVSITAWAEEDDPEAPIDWSKRIRSLETFSAAFRTADGARPGARVSELTRLYGPTRTIDTTEMESREYITFARHPERLRFRLDETRRAILSISVSSF